LAEAARLAGVAEPASRADMEAVARALRGAGHAAWLVKGGHGSSAGADDALLDDEGIVWLEAPRVATRNTHGTGCTLSSAIAAGLAKGAPLRTAVAEAKAYLSAALAGADRLAVGQGPGPVDHFVRWRG
ncbi:MAG: bifunctional hydroxymethylpyrimidine kinase/phosphomethylpyrimidine kinase, partial [Beijerinckiaceae bacterium]|nr:bifunctional hydroxymethylpyrimidine kinase/phosphomethylpyrimidine kinase [Beijerinckiaceae bacterium]